ncbi:hypothetical protein CEXT_412421 [Caerostris extrusa]|uniref:Uncharacterized protein n=1 Tax=Caerostris extrusa TaxID=172846 RepID=A0AAV4TKF0_CAEEX|nr:hypothetical protein CEXT_412421 [Caerostris extrusa]
MHSEYVLLSCSNLLRHQYHSWISNKFISKYPLSFLSNSILSCSHIDCSLSMLPKVLLSFQQSMPPETHAGVAGLLKSHQGVDISGVLSNVKSIDFLSEHYISKFQPSEKILVSHVPCMNPSLLNWQCLNNF